MTPSLAPPSPVSTRQTAAPPGGEASHGEPADGGPPFGSVLETARTAAAEGQKETGTSAGTRPNPKSHPTAADASGATDAQLIAALALLTGQTPAVGSTAAKTSATDTHGSAGGPRTALTSDAASASASDATASAGTPAPSSAGGSAGDTAADADASGATTASLAKSTSEAADAVAVTGASPTHASISGAAQSGNSGAGSGLADGASAAPLAPSQPDSAAAGLASAAQKAANAAAATVGSAAMQATGGQASAADGRSQQARDGSRSVTDPAAAAQVGANSPVDPKLIAGLRSTATTDGVSSPGTPPSAAQALDSTSPGQLADGSGASAHGGGSGGHAQAGDHAGSAGGAGGVSAATAGNPDTSGVIPAFTTQLSAAADTGSPQAASATPVPLPDAADAIKAMIKAANAAGVSTARITLTPASLGGITISLSHTTDGLVARVVADHPEAAQALAQSAGELRSTLEQGGTSLLRLDITNSGGQSFASFTNGGSGGSGGGQTAGQSGQPFQAAPSQVSDDSGEAITAPIHQSTDGTLVDVLA